MTIETLKESLPDLASDPEFDKVADQIRSTEPNGNDQSIINRVCLELLRKKTKELC
jgi:hypothetical protein